MRRAQRWPQKQHLSMFSKLSDKLLGRSPKLLSLDFDKENALEQLAYVLNQPQFVII